MAMERQRHETCVRRTKDLEQTSRGGLCPCKNIEDSVRPTASRKIADSTSGGRLSTPNDVWQATVSAAMSMLRLYVARFWGGENNGLINCRRAQVYKPFRDAPDCMIPTRSLHRPSNAPTRKCSYHSRVSPEFSARCHVNIIRHPG